MTSRRPPRGPPCTTLYADLIGGPFAADAEAVVTAAGLHPDPETIGHDAANLGVWRALALHDRLCALQRMAERADDDTPACLEEIGAEMERRCVMSMSRPAYRVRAAIAAGRASLGARSQL